MSGDPIRAGSPLARTLDDYPVPPLSSGLADRVVANAQARPASLPPLRRAGGGRGWRLGRRIVLGAACFGALASAAAATGLLERFDIAVPSPQTMWASISGSAPAAAASKAAEAPTPATPTPEAVAAVEIVGPIDTPEELGEAFRRIDEVRQGRAEARREQAEQRIAQAIERRRAAGQPLPTPEQEARLRQRMEEAQARRQQQIDEKLAARREELERKIESGEAVTREDILRPMREEQSTRQRERIERLRAMTPEQRREALRQLPPEERRALIEQFRARREARNQPEAAPDAPTQPVEPAEPES